MIDILRKQIDELDAQIIKCIEKRIETAISISELKKKENIPIVQKNRELEILDNVKKSCSKSNQKYLIEIFELILKISKESQFKNLTQGE